ncbi:homoserine kinase [Numidum massiliense]|uniref:homoserine kinase n=1 Tax=Numidum massiliense TaxID=1522315 RepID=UPI0006D5B2F1|nr:homoserine kinase [Numidum massiliense]
MCNRASKIEPFEVVVPGSTANLGPGFDSIGMALNVFTTVRVERAHTTRVVLHGDNLTGLPADETNLIVQVMQKCFAARGEALPSLAVHVWSDIPMTRGLGSSAAALAAGLVAANELLGGAFSMDELLQLGTAWEGHPDNIGASLLGGVVIGSWDGRRAAVVQADPPPLPVVVAIPEYELSTTEARDALPGELPFREAILSSSRANVLTAALLTGRWGLLPAAMQDTFHHPYRGRLVPGLADMLAAANRHGAQGIALSGAGPTLLAFAQSGEEERLAHYLEETFTRHGTRAHIRHLTPWAQGATVQRGSHAIDTEKRTV